MYSIHGSISALYFFLVLLLYTIHQYQYTKHLYRKYTSINNIYICIKNNVLFLSIKLTMQHNMWVCTYQLYVTTCVSEKGLFYQKYSQQSGVQKLYHALRSKLSKHHCQQQRLPMCVSCVSFSQLPCMELRSNREFSTSKMGGDSGTLTSTLSVDNKKQDLIRQCYQ